MKKYNVMSMGIVMFCLIAFVSTTVQADMVPEMKISADLEVFYEYSKNIGGDNDDDQFKTNQLYVTFDGTFDYDMSARLKLDAADLEEGDGKTVSHKVVEEANFTFDKIGGSNIYLVFGKDEMPFGQDYDKYLNDPLVHNFEIDKVWGLNGGAKIADFGKVELGIYEHRNGSPENQVFDNITGRVKADKLVENLSMQVSAGKEEFVGEDGVVKDDEKRWSIGAAYNFGDRGNVNLEYTSFSNRKGTPDYDPALWTIGVQHGITDTTKAFARYEKIVTDNEPAGGLEEAFWLIGVAWQPTKNYTVSAEFTNFNSSDLSDASDLTVADGSIENSFKIGVRAKF